MKKNKDIGFSEKIDLVISIFLILLGVLFIFSAITKFIDVVGFETSIKRFAIIPDYFAGFISYFIPSIEIILGILLILKIKIELSLQLLIYLLIFFTSIIIVKLAEGGDISCGCFGSLSSSNIDYSTILRNAFLICWASLILFFTLKRKHYTTAKQIFKSKIKIFFLVNILFFLIVQNSTFAIRNIELKKRLNWLIEKDILTEGDLVKSFKVFNINRIEKEINFRDSKYTVLFLMQYGCHLCKENITFWNELTYDLLNKKDVRILGISIDPIDTTEKLVFEYRPQFEVVSNSNEDFRNDLKLFKTPLTLIINNDSTVRKIYKGRLNNILLDRIVQEVNNN
jgi:peroxiredoxin